MLPSDFSSRMSDMLGDDYELYLNSMKREGIPSLRINPLKGSIDTLRQSSDWELTRVPWTDHGYYWSIDASNLQRPGKHPFHEAGLYYIQEASAMLPVQLLEAQPGEFILDLCAAPGGKTTQIGAAMQGEGVLVCNEIHPSRAKILSENAERMGLRNAIVTNETPQRLESKFVEYFDRILVDAPCSGEGMFRKHPESMDEWSPENVQLCADRQDEILDCAAGMLMPGGRLVYSTCTFAPAEDEGSVERFLKRHPEFHLIDGNEIIRRWTDTQLDSGHPDWSDSHSEELKKTIRLWPHKLEGEGHFAAVLEKEGEPVPREYRAERVGVEKSLKEKTLTDWTEFQKDTLCVSLSGIFIKFSDQLYLLPEYAPRLSGLKVLRAGLHLGTSKKNRFEPGHALGLALTPPECKSCADISIETARQFINGQTFSHEGSKGWYLVTVNGCSLGWGKLAGDVMKNHYPKGLRKNI